MPEFENIEKFEIRSSKGEVQIPPIAPHSLNSTDYTPGGTRYVGRSTHKRVKKDQLADVTIEPVDIRQMEKDFRAASRGNASLLDWLTPEFLKPSYWIKKWRKLRSSKKIKLKNKPRKGSPKIILRSQQPPQHNKSAPKSPGSQSNPSPHDPQSNHRDGNSSRRQRPRRYKNKGNSPDNRTPHDNGSAPNQPQPQFRRDGNTDASNKGKQVKRHSRRRNRGEGNRNNPNLDSNGSSPSSTSN